MPWLLINRDVLTDQVDEREKEKKNTQRSNNIVHWILNNSQISTKTPLIYSCVSIFSTANSEQNNIFIVYIIHIEREYWMMYLYSLCFVAFEPLTIMPNICCSHRRISSRIVFFSVAFFGLFVAIESNDDWVRNMYSRNQSCHNN